MLARDGCTARARRVARRTPRLRSRPRSQFVTHKPRARFAARVGNAERQEQHKPLLKTRNRVLHAGIRYGYVHRQRRGCVRLLPELQPGRAVCPPRL